MAVEQILPTPANTEEFPTLIERETLNNLSRPHRSAFNPRPCEKLINLKKPTSTLDIECRQFTKSANSALPRIDQSLQYRLWLEAGKFPPPFPPKTDPNYNSNVWRNFRKNIGFVSDADDCTVSEIIAAIYPLNIPPPSKVGDYTFQKYITETGIFKNPKYKSLALQRSKTDLAEFQRLQLKSEMRNPMLDKRGNILPPENFKRYIHKFIPPPTPKPETPDDGVYKIDMFGQITRSKTKPKLWKFSHKLSHPQYEKVKEAVRRRKEIQQEMELMQQGRQELNIEWGRRMQTVA